MENRCYFDFAITNLLIVADLHLIYIKFTIRAYQHGNKTYIDEDRDERLMQLSSILSTIIAKNFPISRLVYCSRA